MSVVIDDGAARTELSRLSQHLLPFAIRALATLGVADELAAGPVGVGELATRLGADEEALYRTLRFAASRGVFRELPGRVFELSPPAQFMRSDVTGNVRAALIIDENTRLQLQVFSEVVHTLRTGEPAYKKVVGVTPFEAMTAHPDAVASFTEQMRQRSELLTEPLLQVVDLSGDTSVVDVGGGSGTLLAGILARHPGVSGTLFELPEVLLHAPAVLERWGVEDRCELVGGDMFTAVPSGADTYLLSSVLHDWPDEDALRILRNVRAAMPTTGRVVIVELLIPEDRPAAARAAQLDFAMMISGGGRERTEAEFAALLDAAALGLEALQPIGSDFYAITATQRGHSAER